jgi:GH15 family glucan-1,4-alpha-glucosidase
VVAAPTTSLPQWPGTARTWDYRYCWVRDGALAAAALVRLGLVDAACSLAAFLGDITARDRPPALVRVDGSPPPAERRLEHLAGYRGSRPVRVGNAAAAQIQLDIAGELTQLCRALLEVADPPASLRAACTRVVAWAARSWREPDHGIWEIRGAPRCYTHSRVMAWTALRDGAALCEQGVIDGDAGAWRRVAGEVHEAVLGTASPSLQLTASGGGPDAGLSCLPLTGFLPPTHPVTAATLAEIAGRLDRGGLLDRCLPEQEASPEPCGPFLFPSFWMASAAELAGMAGQRHFDAAVGARGDLGLFGEVTDPATLTPLGNYPQVQSHAAFILAATEPPAAFSRSS